METVLKTSTIQKIMHTIEDNACINQLQSIAHEICNLFDDGFEIRGVFWNISQAFEKAWQGTLIFKLRMNEISYYSPYKIF